MKGLTPYLLFVLLLLTEAVGFGQNKRLIDINEPTQRELIITKIDSAKLIFPTEPIKAFEYVETAIARALSSGYRYELAEGYYTLADFNFKMGEYTSSISHAGRALEIYSSLQKLDKVLQAYHLKGDAFVKIGEYQQARLNYEQATTLAEGAKNPAQQIALRFKLADLKLTENELVDAERLFKALKKEAELAKNIKLIGEIDFKLGEIYARQGDMKQANIFYDYSNSNAVQTNNPSLINLTNDAMVENSYSSPNTSAHVLTSLNTAEVFFQTTNDTAAWITNSSQKAKYFLKTGQLKDAESSLKQNYRLAEENGNLEAQISASAELRDLYLNENRLIEAQMVSKNYDLLLQKLKTKQIANGSETQQNQVALKNVEKQIDNLQRERDLDQQTILLLEKEKNLNTDELAQQRLLLYVLGGILLIFTGVSVFVYRNIKAKKRAHNLLYLKSLRAQMNPHFIFNSLNSVNNYIAKSDARAANKYLAKFSKLMRQVLEHSQVEFITLAQEIEVLKIYLELEHERFKDQFEYRFEVDPKISLDAVQIPPMLIQPFIENAIWHGLRYREAGGFLEIKFKKENQYIEIIIRDNGIGRNKSLALKTVNQLKHQSTGMKNVESRTEVIQAVFKAKIKHEIIDLPNDAGTEVRIKIEMDENT